MKYRDDFVTNSSSSCFILSRESLEKGLREKPLPAVALPSGPPDEETVYRLLHALYCRYDDICRRILADFPISEEEIRAFCQRFGERYDGTDEELRGFERANAIQNILEERLGGGEAMEQVLREKYGVEDGGMFDFLLEKVWRFNRWWRECKTYADYIAKSQGNITSGQPFPFFIEDHSALGDGDIETPMEDIMIIHDAPCKNCRFGKSDCGEHRLFCYGDVGIHAWDGDIPYDPDALLHLWPQPHIGRRVMVLLHTDRKYRFQSAFDPETGRYARSGVIDKAGRDTGVDPFMASFPELIDIGVMGHCAHGLSGRCRESGIQCYQHGDISRAGHMTLEDYRWVLDQCVGKVFQVALGGCGDPDMHPDFEALLREARKRNIVPNLTTSGFGMTREKAALCKRYCGAVAVSMYSRLEHLPEGGFREGQGPNYTHAAIGMLLEAGAKTNIHFVLSAATIEEAVLRLRHGLFPKGINAVVFLLHKPVGLGQREQVLSIDDLWLEEFFSLVDKGGFGFKIGFDSCTVPALFQHLNNTDWNSLDTCEAARWSMYITPDLKALPCSFDNQERRYAVDLRAIGTIQAAWESEPFQQLRRRFQNRCPGCERQAQCLGGCPLMEEITLCARPERGGRRSS